MEKDEMMERYKARIKRQNEKIKEDYDRVSVTLPKGTKERIEAQGYSFNGLAKQAILSFLEMLEEDQEETETDTPDEPMHPAPVKSADPVEDVKPSTSPQLNREKLEALQAEIEKRKAKAEAEQEAKTAEQEAKEKDQRERAEAYNKEMQEHVKRYGVTGQWLSDGGY